MDRYDYMGDGKYKIEAERKLFFERFFFIGSKWKLNQEGIKSNEYSQKIGTPKDLWFPENATIIRVEYPPRRTKEQYESDKLANQKAYNEHIVLHGSTPNTDEVYASAEAIGLNWERLNRLPTRWWYLDNGPTDGYSDATILMFFDPVTS